MPNMFDQIHARAQQESGRQPTPPTPPPGFTLDETPQPTGAAAAPTPPPGFKLDSPGLPSPNQAVAGAQAKGQQVADAAQAQTHYALSDFLSKAFLHNLGPSLGRFADSVGNTILHPVETGDNLDRLGQGIMQKVGIMPARVEGTGARELVPAQGPTPEQDMADAAGKYVVQRYGHYENIKRTAFEDPVGFAADIASVLGGGSAALKGASKVAEFAKFGRTADILSQFGTHAAAASEELNPLVTPTKVASAVLQKPLAGAARSIYRGALKPPTETVTGPTNASIVEAGLSNAVPVSAKGVAKASQMVGKDQQAVSDIIGNSPAQVDPMNVAGHAVGQFRPGVAAAANPSSDLGTFDKQIQDYLQKHSSGDYPVQEAQAEKIATAKKAKELGAYGTGDGAGGALETGTTSLAHGLRTALEEFFPDIKGVNANEATDIGLQGAIEKVVQRQANRGILDRFVKPSWASGVVGGSSAAFGEHSIPAAIGAHLITKALEDPAVTSRLAVTMYKAAKGTSVPWRRKFITPASRIAEVQKLVEQHKLDEQQ